jgi:capsular polysaccharide biosynthesis protein
MLNELKNKITHLFWRITGNSEKNLTLIEIEYSSPFVNAKDNITDIRTARLMRVYDKNELNGYFYLLNTPCVIEPSLSYAIVGINKIIRPSIYAHEVKPSIGKYIKYRLFNTGNKISLPKAVLFDGSIGTNYFYFFAEVLNKLYVLEKNNIDKAIPLIIGRKVFNTKFFQYLYQKTYVGSWNWLVQEGNDFITCQSLYMINPTPFNKVHWDKTLSLIENLKSPVKPFRRLFVTRPKEFRRHLKNDESIMQILKPHGFEIVDPGSLSFEDQGKIFSETEIIVAVHGSALTNMMFSAPAQLKLLEMMPANRVNAQAGYWVGLFLGIKYYDCLLGTDMLDSEFEVSVTDFEKAFERLMAYGQD